MIRTYVLMGGLSLSLLLTGYSSNTSPETNVASPATQTVSATLMADAELQSSLQKGISSYIKQQGTTPDASHRFFADYIDLNGDGNQDAVVVFSSSYWCGTGGCTMLIFEGLKDKAFRLVSQSTLVRPPLTVSETKTNGWRDLIVDVNGGGADPKKVALKFDGKGYPLNPSVQPNLPAKAPIKGTVLFPDGTQPQTLPTTTSQADLKTYDDPVMAIATRYPINMTVDAACSGEGCGYFFKFKPQGNVLDQSQVHIFLPAGAKAATQAEIGLDDLIRSNGWTVATKATPPQELMYPWVKKIITFSAEKGMTGYILVGETNNQGVRITLLYPTEMSDSFLPAAKTILNNLQFKPDKLPITTRG